MKRWQSGLVKAGIILTYLIPQTLHGITEQDRIQDIRGQIDSLKSKPPADQEAGLKKFLEEVSQMKEFGDEIKGWEKWDKSIKTANGVAEKAKKGLDKEIKKREANIGQIEKAAKGITVTNTSGDISGNLQSASRFEACRFTPDTSYEGDIGAISTLASGTKKDLNELVGKEKKAAEKAQEEFEAEGIAKLLASRVKSNPSALEQVTKLKDEKFSSPQVFIEALRADKLLKKDQAFQAEVKAIEELATFLKKTRELKKGDNELSSIAGEKKDELMNKGLSATKKFRGAVMQAQAACEKAKKQFKKVQNEELNGMNLLNATQNAGYNVEGEMAKFKNGVKDVTCDASFAFQELSRVEAQLTNAANKIGNEGTNPSKLRVAYLEGYKVIPEGLKKVSEVVAATINAQCDKLGDIMKTIENDPSRQQVIAAGKSGVDATGGATASAATAAGSRKAKPVGTNGHRL